MISNEGILYIEPSKNVSQEPIIDELTKKMTAAFRLAKRGPGYRGWHTCACGAHSSNCDHTLPNGEKTNSLCVHYLAYHRDEVSVGQLEKVAALNSGEAEPNQEELKPR
jgi:hypothetical protein